MPDARRNLLHAYSRLVHDIWCAVNIHAGNAVHLDNQNDQVMAFLEMLNQVRVVVKKL
jgi:hypothetical protein